MDENFTKKILRWYEKNQRTLPWRGIRDPYKILVSEIMLQQTQVDRVIPKYRTFLKMFPTVQRLAKAKRADVLMAWSGLGYNRRAVNLQRAAQEIVKEYQGIFPKTIFELEALPGIGQYTAYALASFAFGVHVAAVDTNHRRVVGRFFFGTKNADEKKLHAKSRIVLPKKSAGWNHALMDFGALVCKARPLCYECPLRDSCKAFPKVLNEKRSKKSPNEKFFGSNRYIRGEVVRMLTTEVANRISEQRLLQKLSDIPGVTKARLRSLLEALERDGVVTKRGRFVLLG